MATNKFKSVMVNPSYELEFPTASEFVKVNNIATFGDNVDATFRNLTTNGPITVYGVENALNVESIGPMSLPVLALTGPAGIKFNSTIYGDIELFDLGNVETEAYSRIFKVDQDTLRYDGNKAILPLNTQIGSGAVSVSFSGDENNGLIQLTANALAFTLPGYSYRFDYDGIKLGKEADSYIHLNETAGNVDIHAADTVNISSTNNIALSGNVTINGNTPATFGNNVSGTLKDLTFTDGITINKNKLSTGGEYGSSIYFNDDTLNVAGYRKVYINGYSSGVEITSTGGKISLNSDNNKIELTSASDVTIIADAWISLQAPEVKISDTFTIPVYTTDDSGNYTKVNNETKTVRCVKQVLSDGTATYTLELA